MAAGKNAHPTRFLAILSVPQSTQNRYKYSTREKLKVLNLPRNKEIHLIVPYSPFPVPHINEYRIYYTKEKKGIYSTIWTGAFDL